MAPSHALTQGGGCRWGEGLFNSPREGLCFPGGGGGGFRGRAAGSLQVAILFLNCRLPGVIGKSEV